MRLKLKLSLNTTVAAVYGVSRCGQVSLYRSFRVLKWLSVWCAGRRMLLWKFQG